MHKTASRLYPHKVPYIILFMAFVSFTFLQTLDLGDEIWFRWFLADNSVPELYAHIFRQIGSPHVFTILQVAFIYLPNIVFVLVNAALFTLTAVAINKIVGNNKAEIKAFICILIIFYPYSHMGSAGWIVTSAAYSWMAAFGMIGLVGLAKVLRNERIRKPEYIIYFLCNFIAAGNLQLAPLLLGLYAASAGYLIVQKRYPVFIFSQLFICAANIAYHLLSPGSRFRYSLEVINWFPDFPSLSFINKLHLGFMTTVSHFITDRSLFFLLFCIILFIGVCVKRTTVLHRILALIPLLANLLWGTFNHVFGGFFVGLNHAMLTAGTNNAGDISTYFGYRAYIPLGIALVLIGCISLSLFLIFGKTYKALLVQTIIAGGFATCMILSFSPTIFASQPRTFIFMYFCMIVCAVMIYQEICLSGIGKNRLYLTYGAGLIAILIILERIQTMG